MLVFPRHTTEKYLRCRNHVLTTGTTNASRIVRALGIGFLEVMTHLETMERERIISSADATGRRTLLRERLRIAPD